MVTIRFIKLVLFLWRMDRIEKKITTLLKKRSRTITEVAHALEIERHTAAKYLESLKGSGMVSYKEVGKSKRWSLQEPASAISIQDRSFSILWTNNANQHVHSGRKCYAAHAHGTAMCKNCPVEKTFRSGKPAEAIVEIRGKKKLISAKPIYNDDGEVVAVMEVLK